mmetsp:Transcript_24588/g.40240  ORF Transcript_24588/g.40240 Transcript_24588/m.40240 type:complete len:80 (-) Transcript_24588:61-300(-)
MSIAGSRVVVVVLYIIPEESSSLVEFTSPKTKLVRVASFALVVGCTMRCNSCNSNDVLVGSTPEGGLRHVSCAALLVGK